MWEKGRGHCSWYGKREVRKRARDWSAIERKWALGEKLSLRDCFLGAPPPKLPFLSKTFSLLHLAPPPPPRLLCSPSSLRGNGRLLSRRSKRRNCLRVQSSKKASSIWRDRVRCARRPLPCPAAAAAAAATPASCRRDPEPGPPVSAAARTHAHSPSHTHAQTHTHARHSRTRPHAPSLPGRQLLGPGLLCCSRGGRSRVL